MKVDKLTEGQGHSCPREFVKPMQLEMDGHGPQGTPHRRLSGTSRVSTKSKAPSPPAELKGLDGPAFSQRLPGFPNMTMDQKENLLEKDLTLVVVLPGGVENTATVHGSKPMMDVLVMLCAKYHLNPSGHTIELITTNRNHIKFKPNALIGNLEAERILLKPKGVEDKNKKSGPQMPEATVRLIINYRKTQKTILRVSPRVPLEDLLPAICEKCEFDQQTTHLFRDVQSEDQLDLTSSLNDFGIRVVYARDTKAMYTVDVPASPTTPTSPTHLDYLDTIPPSKDKIQKEKENKGLFSMFRRSKKKPEQGMTASAPASPVLLNKPRPLSMASLSGPSSPYNSNTMPSDVPKKRRAPLPPILVSQSCPSNLSHRQRLNSEPEAQQDGDQKAGLSPGSSLNRPKRKAPPPPVSPSVAVQDEASLDGSIQGGPPACALEEIVEQEEMSASVILDSGTMSDAQEEDSSFNLSPDISMDYDRAEAEALSPPTEDAKMQSSPPPSEGTGEDQSSDLSSDGKLPVVQSTMDSAENTDPLLSAEIGSSKLADIDSCLCQAEEVSEQTGLSGEDSTTQDGVRGECSTESSASSPGGPAKPATQSAETQASGQVNTEAPCDESDLLERPVSTSTPCPPVEDAQVQTDVKPCPVSLHQQFEVPPMAKPSTSGPVEQKRDMATSTEELNPSHIKPAFSPGFLDTPLCQALTPSASPAKAAPPKPCNELTRDYIPKVGMTTYTIVPQKSLEKLRYFEVELTLEVPPADVDKEEVDISSLKLEDCTAQKEQSQAPVEQTEPQPAKPREDSEHTDSTAYTTRSESTVNGNVIEPIHSPSTPSMIPEGDDKISSSTNRGFQAGAIAEVKEMKIPPATKPKPGSFRLPQHKRTPGYYVTSAAVKSANASASPGAGQREAPGSLEREQPQPQLHSQPQPQPLQPVEGDFPPPPPPVQWQEETTGGAHVEHTPKGEENRAMPSPTGPTRQVGLPSKEPSVGLSLVKLRSFAAPRPYSPTTPSRFAQAVSSAVKRSQPVSPGSNAQAPISPPFYPIIGRYSTKEPKGLFRPKESDNGMGEEEKGPELQGEDDPQCRPAVDVTGQMAGRSQPEKSLSMCADELSSNGSTEMSKEPDDLPSHSSESEPSKED